MTTSTFPANKSREVAKTYLEVVKKYPIDRNLEKPIFQGAIRSDEGGITTVGITEPKPEKMDEYLVRLQDSMVMYHDIDGFKYKIEVWYSVVEAMGMLGMKAPEFE
ncbi:MAG: hypothetical protein ACFFHV_11310 [Promethearchaeota archaeon]